MNWPVIIIFGIAALALIIFLIIRNQKDETDFEKQLNQNYRRPRNEEGDAESEEPTH
jgi:hypothetical protein